MFDYILQGFSCFQDEMTNREGIAVDWSVIYIQVYHFEDLKMKPFYYFFHLLESKEFKSLINFVQSFFTTLPKIKRYCQ